MKKNRVFSFVISLTIRIFSFVIAFIVLYFLLIILSKCFTSTQTQIPIPTVKEGIYIYDQDNIINDDVEDKLNQILVEFEKKTEVEFAVVSVKSLLNHSIESYSNNLFNTLGIGKKDKNNGVLLLFSQSDHKVRLEIGKGLENCLSNSICNQILTNSFVPYREINEYTKATELTVEAVLNVIVEKYEVNVQDLEKDLFEKNNFLELPYWKLLSFLAPIMLFLELFFKKDTPSTGGSSNSFSSSDSYGEFSSHSSCGGFGGGSSDGGGASL